jgi:formylglycine-generating enzyme required for sulfatase activity
MEPADRTAIVLLGAFVVVSSAVISSLVVPTAGAHPLSGAVPAGRRALDRGPIVWLPGGWFERGSDEDALRRARLLCLPRRDTLWPLRCEDQLFADELPARRLWVSSFGIDRLEVSHGDWLRCVAAGPCPPSRLEAGDRRVSSHHHPVAGVTFHEAARYCDFVGGRLPTEAEWERAARGSDGRTFPWGFVYNDRLANHGQRGRRADDTDGYRYAAPVDAFPDGASPHGLLNVAGNAWEWTRDVYDAAAYGRLPRMDPVRRGPGGERVIRGGSWRSPPHALRASYREHRPADAAFPDVGFRCAYDAPGLER